MSASDRAIGGVRLWSRYPGIWDSMTPQCSSERQLVESGTDLQRLANWRCSFLEPTRACAVFCRALRAATSMWCRHFASTTSKNKPGGFLISHTCALIRSGKRSGVLRGGRTSLAQAHHWSRLPHGEMLEGSTEEGSTLEATNRGRGLAMSPSSPRSSKLFVGTIAAHQLPRLNHG